ncbi:MAG TPA: IPTL-CTERM sorting domain-containing protein, partial [Thermoanaerobaculia bacterium]|nr:IPTL-CTERM sorting domain-containing protein [Thermoanaerobaculia bacterium]
DGPVEPGDPITYTIVVTNLGPSDVTGATVTDTVPAELSNVTWTCVADPGASCTAMGAGDVNDSVDLPAGTSVTYTLVGDTPGMPTTIENTASVAAPVGVTDPTADNDSDTVTTSVAQVLAIPTLSTYGFVLLAMLLAGLGMWVLRRRGGLVAGLMLLLLLGFAGAADAQTTVDDFATAQGPHANPDGSTGSTVDGAVILGGERDLELTLISGMVAVTSEVTGGAFEFDAPAGTRGEATLTWDGNDNDEVTLDPVGLGGVNLTTTGQSGFRITVDAADAGTELIVRVFTDGSNHSQAARLVPTAIVGTTDVFIPFSEFRTVAGSGADFTNVGAVVLVVRGEDVAVTIDNFDTAGPLLVVEKVDLDPMTNTEIGASEVAAGSTIRYRVTVTNSGGEATTVDVSDMVDGNTTLVSNTLNTTPIAVPDSYRWYGNVTLTVPDGANDLLANDADPDGDTFTITANDAMSEQGGTVSGVNASTGAFTYDPPAGFTGVDSFTYTIQDDDGNMSTATATIALLSTIWFVDSDACALAMLPCGTGTQADPFGELEQAEAASGPNDVIRLRQGGADLAHHNQGILLKAGQQLIGQGVDLVVDGVHIEGDGADDGNLDPNPANRPTLTHVSAGGEGITLADGVTVLGLNVNASMDTAVFGSNVNGVTIDHASVVDSGGAAVEIADSTNLDLTFTDLDSLDSFEHAVHLSNVTGTMTVTGTTQLDDPVMSGIRIESSPGFIASFGAVNVVDAGGGAAHAAVHLASNAGGTFTFGALTLDSENGDGFFASNSGTVNTPASGNTVNAVGGAAVDVESTATANAGGWSFDSLASAGSPDQGVRLVSLGQNFTVGAGGTTITDPDTVGILVQNMPGRSIDFDDASVTDTNVGMGATANGVDLATGNAGATFTFDSLAVTTDGGFGLLANNSGTINVAGTDGNSIVANGGAALDVTSTGAGSGWTFDALSSAGSTGTGVNLVAFSGTVTGESGSITGSAGTAFNVDGGGPTVTYSGSVTQNNAQRVVNVEDTTAGSVTFNTGTVTGGTASLGVRINNADGNASFADLNLGTMGSPMTNQALTLTGGSTGTFGFAGTQIFTTGANGVHANNGGVVEFTGGGNRVTATNA